MATRINLVTNPRGGYLYNGDFIFDRTGWTLVGTNTAWSVNGGLSISGLSQNNQTSNLQTRIQKIESVTAGTQYAFQSFFSATSLSSQAGSGHTSWMQVQFRNGSGTNIGSAVINSSAITISDSGTRSIITTAPAGATDVVIQIGVNTANNLTVNDTYYISSVMMEVSGVVGSYFDGDTESTGSTQYFWNGSAGRSTSTSQDGPPPVSPTVDVGVDSYIATGTAVTRTAIVTDADSVNFTHQWVVTPAGKGTLTGSTTATVTFTPNQPGDFYLTDTVTDDTGRTGVDGFNIFVSQALPGNTRGYIGQGDWTSSISTAWAAVGTKSLKLTQNTTLSNTLRYHPWTGSSDGFYTAGAVGAKAGDRINVVVTVRAIVACRVRLSYGDLGRTVSTFADFSAGQVSELSLLNAISTGADSIGDGVARDQVMIEVFATGSTSQTVAVAGDILYLDRWSIYNVGPTPLTGMNSVIYFDGSSSVGNSWSGTPNQSFSRMIYDQGSTDYIDAEVGYDPTTIVNSLMVNMHKATEENGSKAYGPYRNQSSVILYGPNSATIDVVDGTQNTLAQSYLTQFQAPVVLPQTITFKRKHKKSTETLVDLYDVIGVKNTASGINGAYYVIGIEHEILPTDWTTKLKLRPLDGGAAITMSAPTAGVLTGPDDVLPNNSGGSSGGGTTPTSANNIQITPTGGVQSINVQDAIAELDTEKATVTALNLKANAANAVFTGTFRKPAPNIYTAAATTALTGTATITDIVGATVSVPVVTGDVFLVIVTGDLSKAATATTSNGIVDLNIGGTNQTSRTIFRDDSAAINRAVVSQHYIISGLTAGTVVFKLQGSGAGYTFNTVHTKLSVIKLTT